MFYKLKDTYALRGWKDRPFAVVDMRDGSARFFSPSAGKVLKYCSGRIDFSLALFSDTFRAAAESLAEEGLILASANIDPVGPNQEFKYFDNNYYSSAQWSVTGRCNYRCRHCFMSAPEGRLGELPFEDMEKIMDGLESCGVYRVKLTGGEPLLRRDFMDIVDGLTKRHIHITEIDTNGRLITQELLDKLKSRGLHPYFGMSYDGTEGWHDWLRGVDGAEEDFIRAAKLLNENGFSFGASMCVHEKNRHTIWDSAMFLADLGCKAFKTVGIENEGCWKASGFGEAISADNLYQAYLDCIPRFFECGRPLDLYLGGLFMAGKGWKGYSIPSVRSGTDLETSRTCGHLMGEMYISPEGRVLPCMPVASLELTEEYPLIQENGLKECLEDVMYTSVLDIMVRDILEHNGKCRECEYALDCCGGCRARAMAASGNDWLAPENLNCSMFKGGWVDRVREVAGKYVSEDDNILDYLMRTYSPLAIISYGSFRDGNRDEFSDYDCTVITGEKTVPFDGSVIDGVRLDCRLYSVSQAKSLPPETFQNIYPGEIIYDTGNIGAELLERVERWVRDFRPPSPEEKRHIVNWMEKTVRRAGRDDVNRNFRMTELLAESLKYYFLLRDMFYYGSGKAVRYIEEHDAEGYGLLSLAVKERTNEAITRWTEYVADTSKGKKEKNEA